MKTKFTSTLIIIAMLSFTACVEEEITPSEGSLSFKSSSNKTPDNSPQEKEKERVAR